MTDKQDRINDALKIRISQLEEQLGVTKDRLYNLIDQKDEMEKDMESLRAEAHDVVGQWERENKELRKKADTVEAQLMTLTALSNTQDDKLLKLEENLRVAEETAAAYSNSIRQLQNEKDALEKSHTAVLQHLGDTESGWTEMAQRVKEYELLTTKMQLEIKNGLDQRKQDTAEIEHLRLTLNQLMDENSGLRSDFNDMSCQAQNLVEQTEKLQNETTELRGGSDALHQKLISTESELAEQKKLALSAEVEIRKLMESLEQTAVKTSILDEENSVLQQRLNSANDASQQRFKVIEGLEKEVKKLTDGRTAEILFIEELQRKQVTLQVEIATLQNANDGLRAEFDTIKECYSTLLVESSELQTSSRESVSTLTKELNSVRAEFSEKVILAQHNYEAAMQSVGQLTESLLIQQLREFFESEATNRCKIESLRTGEIVMMTQTIFLPRIIENTVTLNALLQHESEELTASRSDVAAMKAKISDIETRWKNAENVALSHRKSCAALESKLSSEVSNRTTLQSKCCSLEHDNEWLKSQVESMRQELGELDEILNANLNEMREDNEKQQLENEALKSRCSSLCSKVSQYEEEAKVLSINLEKSESELAAQAKTLLITESDLQAASEEVTKLRGHLATTTERLQLSEAREEDLQHFHQTAIAEAKRMQDTIEHQETKVNLILAEKRHEVEQLRLKVNDYVEKTEKYEAYIASKDRDAQDAERTITTLKESVTKMRNIIEELKSRCAGDVESIKQLLAERDDLVKDRDLIVEKYNKLHDAFRCVRKEASGKVAEELKRLLDLCTTQEAELQQIRSVNTLLKKSVSMFVTTAQPKAEAIFVERLNLTEGPLRHPKKRLPPNSE